MNYLVIQLRKINSNYEILKFPIEFFPIEINEIQKKIIHNSEKYSMTGRIRMSLLLKIIEYLNNNQIEGDIVECGVWKGGNLICAQKYINHLKIKKTVIGFDTFEGMTDPTEQDIQILQVKSKNKNKTSPITQSTPASNMMKRTDKHTDGGKNIWAYCSIEDVRWNIKKEVSSNNIRLIKGPVEKTLLNENNLPEKISLLRLDTDFYESTRIELEVLYPKLVNGGFLTIDDYGHWKGSRKAVDEYFNNKMPFLHLIDQTCRLIIKN